MSDETRSRAVEVLHALVAANRIDIARFERAVAELLQARTEAELAQITGSLPPPVAMTPAERRRTEPLKLGGGTGRLRVDGCWQVATQTSIRTELGSVTVDLAEAEFDDRIVDLSVYTGWGTITIVVPTGLGVEVLRHRGRVVSRIEPPIPGFPLVRLTANTNIGRIRLTRAGLDPTPAPLARPPPGRGCDSIIYFVGGRR